MFTDLVGSTDLASALDPEDWHEVLNAYQHRVASIVTAQGGVIAQFQGDGAVAYFGYPEAQESASRDALTAAIAIIEDIVRLGAELPPELGDQRPAGAGRDPHGGGAGRARDGRRAGAPSRPVGAGAEHGGPPAGGW